MERLSMRLATFLVLCSVIFVPTLSQGGALYLKDGSVIQGKLVRFVNDTLYFKTTFGADIRVPRHDVIRVDFVENMPRSTIPAPSGTQVSSAPGTLMISFEKFQVTSRVKVHRGKKREEIERANRIESAFYVGSERVFSEIDSVTDKEIREGPDTVLKNDMSPTDFKVAVAAGTYQCRMFLGNSYMSDYAGSFVDSPLEKKLLVENVKILPGETTQYRIGMKRKMKIGSAQLFVFQ
jgi:hypothetical protein